MLDRYGRVVINPSVPLGVTDFQRLYTGEGSTPEDAASAIHLNYPTEAKSYLADQWSRLGMRTSPEAYFSNPANLQRLQNGTPEVLAAVASLQPKPVTSSPVVA